MLPKNFPQRRERRRANADASNADWRSLSIDAQLKELSLRPGKSAQQVARLQKLKQLGHMTVAVGQGSNPVVAIVEEKQKAPPKADVKATKAFKKKQKANENA